MEPSIHEIDPNGDTLLTLRSPDAPFAVLDAVVLWPDRLPNHLSQQMKLDELGLAGSKKSHSLWRIHENKQEIQMRLSSKHLTLASDYFKRMMANNWKETNPEDGYSFVVTAEEWDQEALLLLMNIIHGHTTRVPRTIGLEMLAKMSILVDYYKCHEAVEFFAKTWISNLTEQIPSTYGRNFLLWLCIAWVFSEADTFRLLTKTVVYQSRGPIHSLGLPIPRDVIDAIEERRQNLVSEVICGLHNMKSQFYKNKEDCTFECSAILLGSLIKGMHAACILDPLPKSQLEGYSFMALEQYLLNIREPDYNPRPKLPNCKKFRHSATLHSTVPHRCTLSNKIKPIIDTQLQTVIGLELAAFTSQG